MDRTYIRTVDADRSLKTFDLARFDESTEGTQIVAFYNVQKKISKFTSDVAGEMGRNYYVFYVYHDSLSFQKIVRYAYSAPFYVQGFKTTIDSAIYDCKLHPQDCNRKKFLDEYQLIQKKLKTMP